MVHTLIKRSRPRGPVPACSYSLRDAVYMARHRFKHKSPRIWHNTRSGTYCVMGRMSK